MIAYLTRRLPSIAALLLTASVVAFALPRLAPGDPAAAVAGSDATPQTIAHVREQMGLDHPLIAQYWSWLTGIFHGDFGQSFITREPVAQMVSARLSSTLGLAAAAGILMVVLGIGLGVLTATVRRPGARGVLNAINAALLSAPPFLTGLLFILVLAILVPVFPAAGEVSVLEAPLEGLRYLTLPAVALALPQAAAIARLVDTSMRGTEQEDFVDLARAKGVPRGRITRHHVLRNSMSTALVAIGLRLGELLAGAIIVEAVFARHGLGTLAVSSVVSRDYFVLQFLIIAAVAVAVMMQLLTDIGVAAFDPRIRLKATRP